eukprot:778746-Rhodomonas_salina.1
MQGVQLGSGARRRGRRMRWGGRRGGRREGRAYEGHAEERREEPKACRYVDVSKLVRVTEPPWPEPAVPPL